MTIYPLVSLSLVLKRTQVESPVQECVSYALAVATIQHRDKGALAFEEIHFEVERRTDYWEG